jgi:hypothetical protein
LNCGVVEPRRRIGEFLIGEQVVTHGKRRPRLRQSGGKQTEGKQAKSKTKKEQCYSGGFSQVSDPLLMVVNEGTNAFTSSWVFCFPEIIRVMCRTQNIF